MPNISITLPDTQQSISRPIVYDIIDQVKQITKINPDAKIFFPGDSQHMATPGSTIDSKDERFALFQTNNIVFIEVEEDYDHEAIGSTASTRPEYQPIFQDAQLGIRLAPIYATTQVTINFKYRCVSKTEALRWRDDIRLRVSQLRGVNLHDITYHYTLPLDILVLLKAIHLTKELVEPYNETYAEFITRNSTPRLTLIGDLVNQEARLAVSEKQCRIVGLYGWDDIPEKPEREDNGSWTVSFSYRFSYEKPIACNFKYPIMIHNNLLPKYYTDGNNKSYDLYTVDKYYSSSLQALAGFESDTTMDRRRRPNFLLRLPEFDDYVIPSCPTGTGSVFIALCEVDVTDQRSLLNLTELGDVVMDPDILNFIKTVEYPFITDLYKSIFHLSLYRNDQLTISKSLTVDTLLNVKSVADLNLRNQHRVRLSIVTDLTLLTRESLDRLRLYPKVLRKVIESMNEIFRNHPDLVSLGDRSYITELEFSPLYALLTGFPLDNGRGTSRGNYYGQGLMASGWPSGGAFRSPIFQDINPRLIEQYRRNRVGVNAVAVTGIMALQQNR